MTYDEFCKEMETLFGDGYCDIEKLGADFVNIKYGKMYENPVENQFTFGLELVRLFDTKKIDFDSDSINGCETCDYGSDYSTTYSIKDIKRNMENLTTWCNHYGPNKEFSI